MTSARGSLRHIPSLIVFALTFIGVGIMRWPLVLVVLALAPLSIAAAWHAGAPGKADE
jgi:chromate transporter